MDTARRIVTPPDSRAGARKVDNSLQALAKMYEEAALDPLFQADNETVLQDFAALDAEAEQAAQ